MPIYEYICPDCDLKFELLRSLSQSGEKVPCPRCNKSAERMVSACAAFSRNEAGESTSVAGTGSSCGSCGSSACGTCGL